MKPAFKVTVSGSDITSKIADRLLEITLIDRAGVKSDRVTIALDDRDQRLEAPKKGAKIEVSLGYVGRPLVKQGKYTVDEVTFEGPMRQMVISGNAVDMTGNIKASKERSWDNITFGDLVSTIAKDNGLSPSIPSALAARKLDHVDQTESDMQLLTRLCADNDATFKISDDRLIVADRAKGKSASGRTIPPVVIDAGDCENWTAVLAERTKYKSVKAYYQSYSSARRQSVTVGTGKPCRSLKNSFASKDEAEHAANGKLKAMNRGESTASIRNHVGDPLMSAERLATLTGFRAGVDGDGWVINQVTHKMTPEGYVNDIELESK